MNFFLSVCILIYTNLSLTHYVFVKISVRLSLYKFGNRVNISRAVIEPQTVYEGGSSSFDPPRFSLPSVCLIVYLHAVPSWMSDIRKSIKQNVFRFCVEAECRFVGDLIYTLTEQRKDDI